MVNTKSPKGIFIVTLLFAGFISSCFLKDAAKDVDETLALKNVKAKYDTLIISFTTPDLKAGDSVGKLSEYEIGLQLDNQIENTESGARDASFDGMKNRVVFDTLEAESLSLITDPFDIPKDSIKIVSSTGSLNLETHKKAGKYIIQQTVDGNSVKVTITPVLIFKVSELSFEPEIFPATVSIPTRVSDETKKKLQALLNSGLLDQ